MRRHFRGSARIFFSAQIPCAHGTAHAAERTVNWMVARGCQHGAVPTLRRGRNTEGAHRPFSACRPVHYGASQNAEACICAIATAARPPGRVRALGCSCV